MKNRFLILLFLLSGQMIYGQTAKSVGLQYFNEQIVIAPFAEQSESPAHPGGILSFAVLKKDKSIYHFSQTFQLGYYHHQDVNQVIFLAWKPKYEWRFFDLLSIHAIPGLGYAHSFPTQSVYKLEDDTYKKSKTVGHSHFAPSLGIGFGVHLDKLNLPLELFVRQEYMVLFPNTRRLPISLNSLLGVGVKYSFNQKSKNDD